MPRYAAFLRGVSPLNARMPELKRCFEGAGFTNVKTIRSSGNVVFDSAARSEASVERKAEKAMEAALDRGFLTIVRPIAVLKALFLTDPFAAHPVPAEAKRVVTFLRDTRTPQRARLLALDDESVVRQVGREIFTAYLPSDKSPALMALIEKAFGKDITTRTWETVRKCAAA